MYKDFLVNLKSSECKFFCFFFIVFVQLFYELVVKSL